MASPSKRPRLDDSFSLGGHTGGVVPEGSQPAGESTRSGVCRSPWRARVCALYARTLSVLRRAAAHVLKKKQPGANGEREEPPRADRRAHKVALRGGGIDGDGEADEPGLVAPRRRRGRRLPG